MTRKKKMRRRTRRVEARLSNNEYELLNLKCKEMQITKSDFFRYALKGFIPDKKLNSKVLELIFEIKRIGNNINQIAKHANTTGKVNELFLLEYINELNNLKVSIVDNLLNNKYGCNEFMESK